MPDKASKNKRYSIHSHRIVVIVIQVKSGQKYGRIPHWYLCDAMPNWLKKHKGPSAVFSIVFALAAKEPTIKFKEPKGQDKPCYIWCAGISPEVLPQVLDAQQGAWDGILRASRPWENIFEGVDGADVQVRQHMYPGGAAVRGFYEKFYEVEGARVRPSDEK